MIDAAFLDTLKEQISSNTSIRALGLDVPAGPLSFEGRVYGLDVPAGRQFQDLTAKLLESLPNPRHRRGTQQLLSLESFAAYVNRFKLPNTALYAEV